jgi:hypothetical protein
MLFHIKGADVKQIDLALDEFCEVCEKEWGSVVEQKKSSLISRVGKIMPITVKDFPMPEEITIAHYIEKDYVVLNVAVYIPTLYKAIAVILKRTMLSSLKDYFAELKIPIKEIEFKGWK